MDAAGASSKPARYTVWVGFTEYGMPLFGQRVFALRIPGAPTGGAYR